MKKIKMLLPAVIMTAALSGCTKIWEDRCVECIPLPDTEITVTPDPWEPEGTDENPVGE